MGLTITSKQAVSAKSKIGKFDVDYNFEHLPGESPEVVRVRASKPDSNEFIDATYFPNNNNFSITFHYLEADTDVAMPAVILKEIKQLLK